MTGQQYWVRKDSAHAKASVKPTKTKTAPQLLQPQRVTRSTSGTHRGISRPPPERHHLGTGFAQGQRGGRKVVERRMGQAFFERASNGLRRSFVTSRRPHARRRPSVGWVCRIGCRAGGKYGLPALSAGWSSAV